MRVLNALLLIILSGDFVTSLQLKVLGYLWISMESFDIDQSSVPRWAPNDVAQILRGKIVNNTKF